MGSPVIAVSMTSQKLGGTGEPTLLLCPEKAQANKISGKWIQWPGTNSSQSFISGLSSPLTIFTERELWISADI